MTRNEKSFSLSLSTQTLDSICSCHCLHVNDDVHFRLLLMTIGLCFLSTHFTHEIDRESTSVVTRVNDRTKVVKESHTESREEEGERSVHL